MPLVEFPGGKIHEENPTFALVAAAVACCLSGGSRRSRPHPQPEGDQQDRIAQGVGSGQLTARESARLESREAHLNREVAHARQDGGTLTPASTPGSSASRTALAQHLPQKHDGQTQ